MWKMRNRFDELCDSISAINFPVAPLSKMEARMIEPLFLSYFIFRHLPAHVCDTDSEGGGVSASFSSPPS